MSRGIPRLDTYVAPDARIPDKPAAPTSPAAVESALADLSAEMTAEALERRKFAALEQQRAAAASGAPPSDG